MQCHHFATKDKENATQDKEGAIQDKLRRHTGQIDCPSNRNFMGGHGEGD